ncbi:MAG TPA: hypothetical protein VJV78_09570 [Polyangiales bacterium]|nr:hypothetical protein [Polyangiales bacterium]
MPKTNSGALLCVAILAGFGCSSGSPNATGVMPTLPATGGAAGGAAVIPPVTQPSTPATGSPSTPTMGTGTPPTSVTPPASMGMGTPPAGNPMTTPPPAQGAAGGAAAMPPTGNLPPAKGGPISMECRGFSFENIQYSPGGTVLPNKCEAFHPTLNNPAAVRCVDVWPWWKTQFAGDNFCVLPPPPDKGIQIGHHPQGEGNAWFNAVSKGDMSIYMNPPAGWTVPAGGEEERNILIKHPEAKGGKFYAIYSRMRGGSHHMIVSTLASAGNTFVWGPGGADGLFNGAGIPGAQRPDENMPQSVDVPEEDVGLYRTIADAPIVQYNMHHFNATDKPILKEAWQNLWWTDNPKTAINAISGLPIIQAVGTFAQPGQIVDMHYASTIPAPMRIIGLFGHRHAWTTNFTAWVERDGKQPEIIYQSFDWFDEPTYGYNSQVKNPVPAPMMKTDGASSGVLKLNTGDRLHFNCHIEYTDARAKSENSPVTPSQNGPLRFANQAFTAEMCILFGAAVGDNGAMQQMGAPPDFAK